MYRYGLSMPELPEVETVLYGLKPHLEGAVIQDVIVREQQLRWPIPDDLKTRLTHQTIGILSRRAKYLIIPMPSGSLIVHLGMSGSLRIVTKATALKRHDHVDIIFSDTHLLRYNDPRRFGAILWNDTSDACAHPLLQSLGPEPLESHFTAGYLKQAAMNRRIAIKSLIMNNRVVVGIGNIYAAEALFLAKIHPTTPAGALTETDCRRLVEAIQQVLCQAIRQGGTSLKDFVNSEGKPGYFANELQVYGRAKLPCTQCKTPLQSITLGQRGTVFCANCQKISQKNRA